MTAKKANDESRRQIRSQVFNKIQQNINDCKYIALDVLLHPGLKEELESMGYTVTPHKYPQFERYGVHGIESIYTISDTNFDISWKETND